MFLGVPSSATDQLQYNAHRIYGPVRLPMLTANWEVLGVYDALRQPLQGLCGTATCQGLFKHFEAQALAGIYQPVIVLRNQRTTPCGTGVQQSSH